jgi:hypothetical protein
VEGKIKSRMAAGWGFCRGTIWPRVEGTELWLRRFGWVLLLVLGVLYYALYFFHGLALTGEGGTNAVLAQRLLEGQLPIKDTFLGYNVGWFYPLVGLFALFGPNYLVMKAFFVALSLAAGLLGGHVVRRVSGSALLGFVVGLILILIPGMLFRNYMGLLGVVNQWALLWAFLWPVTREGARVWRFAVAGMVLGATYLVRIEVGLLLTPVYVGLWIGWLAWWPEWRRRWRPAFLGLLAAMAGWMVIHMPFAWDARVRGYDEAFWGQYESFPKYLRFLWQEKWQHLWSQNFSSPEVALSAPAEPQFWPVVNQEVAERVEIAGGEAAPSPAAIWRARPDWRDMFLQPGQRERYFAAAIFVPPLVVLAALLWGLMAWFGSYGRKDGELNRQALSVLVLWAGALALFPQYFFFRPDTPHLTEFMIPFLVAAASTMAILVQRWWQLRGRGRLAMALTGVCTFVMVVWLHFGHAWPKESAGTIAAWRFSTEWFVGLNGVRALVAPEQAEGLRQLQDVILRHAEPDDFVAAMPYSPTINLMTNRRSHLWNLYMDNSNQHGDFERWQIAKIEEHRPKVIVIDNRDVNKTEASRFRNWAAGIYRHIREKYDFVGSFLGNDVYVRREVGA